jgi:hypothetical protein
MTLAQRRVMAARPPHISHEHKLLEDEIKERRFEAHMDYPTHMRHVCLSFNHHSIARALICACNAPWAVYRLGQQTVDVCGRMPPELRAAIAAAGGRTVSLSDTDHQIQA